MKLSELISKLDDIKNTHGDHELLTREPGYDYEPSEVRLISVNSGVMPEENKTRGIWIDVQPIRFFKRTNP